MVLKKAAIVVQKETMVNESAEDPDFFSIVSRDAVEDVARRDDALGALASKMLASTDEAAIFRDGARAYVSKVDRTRRRFALAVLAKSFGADVAGMKRLLRFWGILNERD
jgi:hypothetical protein